MTIELISADAAGNEGNDASSTSLNSFWVGNAFSSDGRFVVFTSGASNLVADDTNGRSDVFVRDLQNDTIRRVSVSSLGVEGNGDSLQVSISGDGNWIVFSSTSSNLVAGDLVSADVFLYDFQNGFGSGTVTRITSGQANGHSTQPTISANGQYIAFSSFADDLVAGDTNIREDVFVYDRVTSTATRVSVNDGGTQGNEYSSASSISADGRFVAFESFANNLVAGDTNGDTDVFVRDLATGITTRVSVTDSEAELFSGNGSYQPTISADGRYVTFTSNANDLPGSFNISDVYVRDRLNGTTTLVSESAAGADGNANSFNASISGDGRFVTFMSRASNLVPGDDNLWGGDDVFVKDMDTGAIGRLSVTSTGQESNNPSDRPVISANGGLVAFNSTASNLVPGDTNSRQDVFLATVDTSGSITINAIATDNLLTRSEADDPAGLIVSGTTDADAGSTVSVSFDGIGLTGQPYNTIVQPGGTWSVTVPSAGLDQIDAAADTTYTVRASVIDFAGNPAEDTQTLAVDTTATITIGTIAGNNTLSQSEAFNSSGLIINGTTLGLEVGRTVSVTFDGIDLSGEPYTTTVQAGGTWSVTVPLAATQQLDFAPDTTYTVRANASDVNGNAAEDTQALVVDTTATVAIDAIATDNTLNQSEVDNPAGLVISGTTDVEVGRTVAVNVDDSTGFHLGYGATVQAGGTWSIIIDPVYLDQIDAAADTTYTVSAGVADANGNTGFVMRALGVDTTATITIDAIATDDRLNQSEADNLSGLVISGTTSGVEGGQSVSVSFDAIGLAGEPYTTTVQAGGAWSVTVSATDLDQIDAAADGTYTVRASVTDMAGNPSEDTQALVVDTALPVITIGTIATDNTLNGSEADNLAGLVISGTTSGVEVGQTVSVSFDDIDLAGEPYTTTVQAGGTWSVTVSAADLDQIDAAADGTYTVRASVTDMAGNPSEDTQALVVDTTATITIDSIATDNTLNQSEVDNLTGVVISGMTSGMEVGRTVSVTFDGIALTGEPYTTTVQAGGAWSVTVAAADLDQIDAAADGTYTVRANVSDANGNAAEDTQALAVDTTASITIGAIAGDNTLNQSEADNLAGLVISGTTSGLEVGRTVSVTFDGIALTGEPYTTTVQAGGTWSVTVSAAALDQIDAAADGTYTVRANVTDLAGNTAEDTQALTVVTIPPAIDLNAAFAPAGQIGAEWAVAGVADFGGSDTGDVMWVRGSTGTLALWNIEAGALAGAAISNGSIGGEWHVGGTGDFNADGKEDIVWSRNMGDVAIWQMDGANVVAAAIPPGQLGLEWAVTGVGDLNGDGKDDLVWTSANGQAVVWTMNGLSTTAIELSNGAMGSGWEMIATGDFTGNGRDDLLWRNETSGDLYTWSMNGATLEALNDASFEGAPGNLGGTWDMGGVADFSGDGNDDIVWVNSVDNDVQIWEMNDAGDVARISFPAGSLGTEWHFGGVAELTGDATPDILWNNDAGQIAIFGLRVNEMSGMESVA